MYGGIIGDVAGSYLEILEVEEHRKNNIRKYEERIKILNSKEKLFTENSSCTDDSFLIVAIADAILSKSDYESKLKEYALREIKKGEDMYGRSRFSSGFTNWAKGLKEGVSNGNGSIMRIGPIGYLFDDEETILEEAKKATIPSHNTEEAIKCAGIIALTINMALKGLNKNEIKEKLERKYELNLNYDLEDLQKNNKFSAIAMPTTKLALFCFLISENFEDAIRKALSIGGDSDTLAAVVSSISEAYYGVPKYLIDEVERYIPDYFHEVLEKFYKRIEIKIEENAKNK